MTELKNGSLKESLSALVDNEGLEQDLQTLLDNSDDQALRSSWARYHAASRVMRNEPVTQVDLSASIMAAIDKEALPALDSSTIALDDQAGLTTAGAVKSQGFFGSVMSKFSTANLGRAAVACSVTFAVFMGVQNFQEGTPVGEEASGIAAAQSNKASSSETTVAAQRHALATYSQAVARPVGTQQRALPPSFRVNPLPASEESAKLLNEAQLQKYFSQVMMRHAEESSAIGSMGLIPVARASRFQTEK